MEATRVSRLQSAREQVMENIALSEAKERLEELIERAARGEDVCISDPKHGNVRLTPTRPAGHAPPYPKRIPGLMKDRVQLSNDELFAPLTPEELAWLSGESSP